MKQFFLLLVLSLWLLFPKPGLSLSGLSGHMLDRFELIPDEKTPFLTFKGFFDPGQFPHIQIFPRNSKTENYLILPTMLLQNVQKTQQSSTNPRPRRIANYIF